MAGAALLPLAMVVAAACSPATGGYGGGYGDESADDDSGDDELGYVDSNSDTDAMSEGNDDTSDAGDPDQPNDTDDTGDGDPDASSCEDPSVAADVTITLLGAGLTLTGCDEPSFSAHVLTAVDGVYGLLACACADPNCDGEALELTMALPDPSWLPALEPGSCHQFQVFAEELQPGVCRRNRIDIAPDKWQPPWYSAGSASEDLDRNGIKVQPLDSVGCDDDCGEWKLRNVTFTAKDLQTTLGWGQAAPVGTYEVINWRSYLTPNGCGNPSVDVTAWTVR